jgi:hypothetical protein
MKMEHTKCSETLAFKRQMPVDNPEEIDMIQTVKIVTRKLTPTKEHSFPDAA